MGCRGAYGSCWNNTVPSTQLVDMYEFKDGRPFNWDEIFPGYNAMTPEQRQGAPQCRDGWVWNDSRTS